MQTTVELPESIYRRAEESARARGVSLDVLISDLLERDLTGEAQSTSAPHRVSLPIIDSSNPGSLDLSNFDFDDLLA